MGIKMDTLTIQVTGSVKRVSDGTNTDLTMTEAQLREAHGSIGLALDFFDAQSGTNAEIVDHLTSSTGNVKPGSLDTGDNSMTHNGATTV